MKTLSLIFICSMLSAENVAEKVFTEIYERGPWNESGFVQSGSQIEMTREYVAFLQDFLRKNEIHTVVDLGCGDWAFSRYIDWSGIQYTGIDIVKLVIKRNQRLFAASSIVFIQADALDMELPQADLLLCKDVLQHLPNGDIIRFLKQLSKFKHCLITNYVEPAILLNVDTDCGGFHPVDLTQAPFNIEGSKVLTFTQFIKKQTLYIRN